MTILGWALALAAFAVLLSRARLGLRPLPAPAPSEHVPPYTLWLGEGAAQPVLDPPPRAVVRGRTLEALPATARVLRLAAGVDVAPSLPRALAACGPVFVSVFPLPRGDLSALTRERWLRDFAGPGRVADPRDPAGFADERCAWFEASDLALRGEDAPPVLRMARARKAHLLPVEVRHGGGRAPLVTGPGISSAAFREGLPAWTLRDPVVVWLAGRLPLLFTAALVVGLAHPDAREGASLALFLSAVARLWAARAEGFGLSLSLAGALLEPVISARVLSVRAAAPTGVPAATTGPSPRLTGARGELTQRRWLDEAAVPFLARRLGGAARVMEQLYGNRPSGRTARGLLIDRWVQASPAARAVRWRRLAVARLGRALAPESLLSVPCGGATDAAEIGAAHTVLVDPDPAARSLARDTLPSAEIVGATLEGSPTGPFALCLFVGLSEYLDDTEVVRALVSLRARLTPEGALITTMTAQNESQARMRELLGWHTRGRRAEAFVTLLDAAGFRIDHRESDPLGLQWVFVARPLGAPPSPAPSH
jgi:hypothetical protein